MTARKCGLFLLEALQGENAPPLHPRCQCTIAPEVEGTRLAGRKRIPAVSYKEWRKSVESDKIPQGGALNDINDPNGKRRDKHAEMYYATRRNSKKEPFVKRVAQNSGMSEKAVGKIFDHIFMNEHYLQGELRRFDPSYDMAESFRRLSEGKNIQPHDLIMLRHEWLELSLMKRYGYEYDTAHGITERKYNYSLALNKWLAEGDN